MRIYIAGSFVDQQALRPEMDRVWKTGHEVTGTWLNEVAKPAGMDDITFQKKLAIKDLCEVARADVVILDNRRSSGGKNVEWGFALGEFQHKQLWLIGAPSTVFHHLADHTFAGWDECIYWLAELSKGGKNEVE